MDWAASILLILMLEKLQGFCLIGLITLVHAIDVKMDGSLLEEI